MVTRWDLGLVGIIIVAVVFIPWACYATIQYHTRWEDHKIRVKEQISQHVKLQKGIIASPSVIIEVESFSGFIELVKQRMNVTVYYEETCYSFGNSISFYLFENNMLVAYRYYLRLRDFK